MNILIAPDKFKDGANALEICDALERGIIRSFPVAKCKKIPLADGGEGTLEAISSNFQAAWQTCQTKDPLFRKIEAVYLFIPEKKIAIIEMARASGIELLKPEERNALITSSFGTGLLIRDAIEKGAEEIFLTVGGSATNDAGIGIAEALGFEFYDKRNQKLIPIGANLLKIERIDDSKIELDLTKIKFTIATDVENPFHGKTGAAHVFAKQKGADSEAIELLDKGLQNFSILLEKFSSKNPQLLAGSGAAGGVGGGIACLLNAHIISAADWILELNNIEMHISECDILITGEGKIDSQTWDGKLISRLLTLAEKAQKPVMAICGTLEDIDILQKQSNIIYTSSIITKHMSLETALKNTTKLVEEQGVLIGKLLPSIEIKYVIKSS